MTQLRRHFPAPLLSFTCGVALLAGCFLSEVDPALVLYPRYLLRPLLAVGTFLVGFGLAPRASARIAAWVRGNTAALVVLGSAVAVFVGEALIVRTASSLAFSMFLLNCASLAGLTSLAIGITNRLAGGVAISLYLFLVLEVANALKLHWLLIPVYPNDVRLLPDLVQVTAKSALFGTCAALGILAWAFAAVATRWQRRPTRRAVPIVAGATALFLVWLSGGWLTGGSSVPLRAAAAVGHFNYFLWHTRDFFVPAPAGYDRAAIQRLLDRLTRSAPSTERTAARAHPTVVLYLIESFTAPAWFGYEYTGDPIPRFRALCAKSPPIVALAPGFGGGSANAEFELLTGLPVALLPPNRVPYVQDVWRKVPSIPWALKALGYRTSAIHAGLLRFYNIDRVYPLLGFDRLMSVKESGAERDPTGRYGRDDAVVDEILRIIKKESPAFIFAFPASTHWPYDYDVYMNSPLDVVDADLEPAPHHQIKTYINAIHVADRAFGRLVDQLAAIDRPILLVALGDHWPPLSHDAYAKVRNDAGAEFGTRAAEHRVPVAIWSNYPVAPPPSALAFSALSPVILDMAGVSLDSYWTALNILGRELATTRHDWQTGNPSPARTRALLDLTLLEYDVLFGQAFSRPRVD
jgi:phosphoglycerol transferase MdoB-like AlkP superfamily enzyme